jgi:hypothetical protein
MSRTAKDQKARTGQQEARQSLTWLFLDYMRDHSDADSLAWWLASREFRGFEREIVEEMLKDQDADLFLLYQQERKKVVREDKQRENRERFHGR